MKTRAKSYQKPIEKTKDIKAMKIPPQIQPTQDTIPPKSEKDKILTEKLTRLYEDISSAPSYSAKIANFLRHNYTHSLHRRITKKTFPRRRVISRFPFENFMGDLIEYPNYKWQNNGYQYILVLIDCFTKMIYVRPMKRKSKEWTADAFQTIFKEFDSFPINLITDSGLEFFNSDVEKIFTSYGINHFAYKTKTKWKASIVERVIRTIKSRLEKRFHVQKKNRWIDILDQVVQNYNSTPHSAHQLPPLEVNDENRDIVYKRMYPLRSVSVVCRLREKDRVRKIREKTIFEKGYKINWSEEIYEISSIRQSNGVCWYTLVSLDNIKQPGIYYYYQLNLVSRHDNQSQRDSGEQGN